MLAPVARLLVPLEIGLFADLAAPALMLRSVWVGHLVAFEVDAAMWAGSLLRRRARSRASSRAPLVLAATRPCWNRRPRPHCGHTPRRPGLAGVVASLRRCFGWALWRCTSRTTATSLHRRFLSLLVLVNGLVSGAGGLRHKQMPAVPGTIEVIEPLSSCSTKTRINDKEHMH